jgi:hypothetical protein
MVIVLSYCGFADELISNFEWRANSPACRTQFRAYHKAYLFNPSQGLAVIHPSGHHCRHSVRSLVDKPHLLTFYLCVQSVSFRVLFL